ncbi:hypothetical protein ACFQZC_10600 [Streptacidiphilus monticola]
MTTATTRRRPTRSPRARPSTPKPAPPRRGGSRRVRRGLGLAAAPAAHGRRLDARHQAPLRLRRSRYRDYDSNSSGGMGLVTGRTAALAADDSGDVWAASAGGGVWRSRSGGGHWQPISDALPAQASGALTLDGKGRLWYGTGESSTNSDAYLGSGVYLLDDPVHGKFEPGDRVGGTELESTAIHELRIHGDRIWAATTEGLWSHSLKNKRGAWTLEYAPNPDYLPGHPLANDPASAYKNIVSDVAFDPKDPSKVVAAVGWRSGDSYNGFFSRGADGSWTRLTSLGDLPTDPYEIGTVTFAASADGSRYYAIDQSPNGINGVSGDPLAGIFVSRSGSPSARGRRSPTRTPWSRPVPRRASRAASPGTTSSCRWTRPTRTTSTRAWRRSSRPRTAVPAGPRRVRTGTSTCRAGASTRRSRRVTARRPPTRTSTPSRSARCTARRCSSWATTAASTAVRSPAARAPTATPPTGPRSTTAPSTRCSTTRWAWARTWPTAAWWSPAACRTTGSRSCAAATP